MFQQMVLIQKQQEYLVEQQKLEERQRMEKEILEKGRLSQIKNKNKDEESKIFNPLLAALLIFLSKITRHKHKLEMSHSLHWGLKLNGY